MRMRRYAAYLNSHRTLFHIYVDLLSDALLRSEPQPYDCVEGLDTEFAHILSFVIHTKPSSFDYKQNR